MTTLPLTTRLLPRKQSFPTSTQLGYWMTGLRIAFGAGVIILGGSSAITGVMTATVPGLSSETPVTMTLAMVGGGVMSASIFAWRISRAWSSIENRLARLEEKIDNVERHYWREHPERPDR